MARARPWWKAAFAGCALTAAAIAQPPEPTALPELPATPVMDVQPYPDCRFQYRERNLSDLRAAATMQCVEQIDGYHAQVLAPFWERMAAHVQALDEIHADLTGGSAGYEPAEADRILAYIVEEREASLPDGAHFMAYREAEARYRDDRAFLEERFCRYTRCETYEPTAVTAERDVEDGMTPCGDESGDSMYVGGLLGRLMTRARDMGGMASSVVGSMVSFACRLRPEEQALAEAATEEVVAQEQVGATAEWVSPTRADVSGSSTVTALNSQPNGATCLDITDIVIIEGEEARMTKRMCRAPGETRYILQA